MPDANPLPTICRTMLYTLTEQDAHAINRRRADGDAYRDYHRAAANGTQVHVSNKVHPGDVYPLIITHVSGSDPTSAINGQVLLDGNDSFWATSVVPGEGEGKYQWPTRS